MHASIGRIYVVAPPFSGRWILPPLTILLKAIMSVDMLCGTIIFLIDCSVWNLCRVEENVVMTVQCGIYAELKRMSSYERTIYRTHRVSCDRKYHIPRNIAGPKMWRFYSKSGFKNIGRILIWRRIHESRYV